MLSCDMTGLVFQVRKLFKRDGFWLTTQFCECNTLGFGYYC